MPPHQEDCGGEEDRKEEVDPLFSESKYLNDDCGVLKVSEMAVQDDSLFNLRQC